MTTLKLFQIRGITFTCLVLWLLHLSTSILAQGSSLFKISITKEFKEDISLKKLLEAEDENYYFSYTEFHTLVNLSKVPDLYFESRDKNNFNKVVSASLTSKIDHEDAQALDVLENGNSFYAFLQQYDKHDNKFKLLVQQVEKKTCSLTGSAKQILTHSSKNALERNRFHFVPSPNKKILTIVVELPSDDKGKNFPSYQVNVLDEKMTALWQNIILVPHPETFQLVDFNCNDEGVFFISGLRYGTAKDRDKGTMYNRQPSIIACLDKGAMLKEIVISEKNNFLTDVIMSCRSDGKIKCSGFYGTTSDVSTKGVYSATVDPISGKITEIKNRDFSQSFLDSLYMIKIDAPYRMLRSTHFETDTVSGECVLFGEEYYTTSNTVSTYNSSTQSYSYKNSYSTYYCTIVTIRFNANGDVESICAVPKKYFRPYGGYRLTYHYIIKPDRIFLLLNDHVDNLNQKDPSQIKEFGSPGLSDKSFATIVTIERNGSYHKDRVFQEGDENSKEDLGAFDDTIDGKLVVFTNGAAKNFKLGTIEFY